MATPMDLVHHSEGFLDDFGPATTRGVGNRRGDADTGYRVSLQVIRDPGEPVSLLDFGCGLSMLNDVLVREGPAGVTYAGLDLSDRFLAESRRRYPDVAYYKLDVLTDEIDALPMFDYVVINGILHYKGDHSDAEMWPYLRALVTRLFSRARMGLAFSVMSTHVDWERDDLFHVPVDALLDFLTHEVSRHVVIRHDYGLYEYTAYVYRSPSDPDRADARHLLRPRPEAGAVGPVAG